MFTINSSFGCGHHGYDRCPLIARLNLEASTQLNQPLAHPWDAHTELNHFSLQRMVAVLRDSAALIGNFEPDFIVTSFQTNACGFTARMAANIRQALLHNAK